MGTIILFGVLAGLDNLQVAPALALMRMRAKHRLMMALAFGLFESAMPLIGLSIGYLFQKTLEPVIDGIGPLVLIVCGALIICMALKEKDTSNIVNSRWVILGLPFSLSLDNLVAGLGLGAAGYPVIVSALVTGMISAAMCLIAIFFGDLARRWIPGNIEVVSGAYLVILAIIRLIRLEAFRW
jgi:manganese efflux pump family protein